MAKAQKKTGKGRLDKYYKLAKEQGYRARSAFKLIQLNKKFGFLESSRCTIDLCAAPGGWLQVATKYMPMNSIIVGVDLVPIKSIPRVVTFASDITTPQCRTLIRNELKDWKADVVLHDGAPNVGTAWIQDAYTQSELVLMSLKLAVEFLVKGGTFVTKVFRSVDYNNLIWVFNQIFGKVEATKPPSSRNVSAEIFVVCREFLAPMHLDPKFLDPKYVFKDLSADTTDKGTSINNVHANVFHPEKKRRKREGYVDGDYTLFKDVSASEFIQGCDPIAVLGTNNRISFTSDEEKRWLQLEYTTTDVRSNCEDLKVLGKGDFKTLIKWRLRLREELGLDINVRDTQDVIENVMITEEVDEEQQISEELERLNAECAARAKRERRRANELRTKTLQRMQLQMTAPLDIGLEQNDAALGGQDDIFALGQSIRKKADLLQTMDQFGENEYGEANTLENDSEKPDLDEDWVDRRTRELENQLEGLYKAYQDKLRGKDTKYRVREARKKNTEGEEWHGIQEDGEDGDSGSDTESLVGGWDGVQQAKGHFDDSSSEGSDSDDIDTSQPPQKRTCPDSPLLPSSKRARLKQNNPSVPKTNKSTNLWFSQEMFVGIDDADRDGDPNWGEEGHPNDISDDSIPDDEEYEEITAESDNHDVNLHGDMDMRDTSNKNVDEKGSQKYWGFKLDTPEAITIAQHLVNREKTKTQLINDGFHRYSLNDKEDLPAWFLDDESKHYKIYLPVTKEAVQALHARQRALDARPIKKVAEAKARKKFKAAKRIEKAMAKAEGINSTSDISERDKAQQIQKLMGKAAAQKPKKDTKLVVAKGAHKGIKGRPRGVKGRYVMVDSRMRKELREKRRKAKETKNRRK